MLFSPFDYQKVAIDHMHSNPRGCLFMGCGLGKTSTTLQVASDLYDDCATRGILIVAPVRVCNLTWDSEAEKWDNFKWMRVANLRTEEGWKQLEESSAHIYCINYEMLPKFQKTYLKGRRFKNYAFDTVVFDESTRLKNPDSVRIKSVRAYLERHIERVWALTGEPTPNSLLEIFGQMLVVDKGQRLGRSYAAFRDRYFETTDYHGRVWEPKQHAKEAVHRRISDICLTLRSIDHLNIPDQHVEDVSVTFPNKLMDQYRELQKEAFLELDEQIITAETGGVLANKLCQFTSGVCYDEEKLLVGVHDKKIQALKKIYKSHKGPLLVMCHFTHEQPRIRDAFPEAKFFADAKNLSQEKALEKAWNAGEVPMLVANPQSAGHGLNLQFGGNGICWFTPCWSGEYYNQANFRLWRTGQDKAVSIYRLIVENTIDERIVETLRHKEEQQIEFLKAIQALRNMD